MTLFENFRSSLLNTVAASLEMTCPKISKCCDGAEQMVPFVPLTLRVLGLSPNQYLQQFLENSLTDSSNIIEKGVESVQTVVIGRLTDKAFVKGLSVIVRQTGKCAESVLRSEFMESYRRGNFNNREVIEIRQLLEGVGMSQETIDNILNRGHEM